MKLQTSVFLCFVLAILTACSSTQKKPPLQLTTMEEICVNPIEKLGDTRQSVIAFLKQPQEERVTTVPNRHNKAAKDTYIVLIYPSLDVLIHEIPSLNRSFLEAVTLTAENRELLGELSFDTEREEFERAWPPAQETSSSSLTYRCSVELYDVVELEFSSKQRLKKVTWQRFVD